MAFRTFFNPAYAFCLMLFLFNQSIENMGIHLPIIAYYLDDILCLPLLLTPVLFVFRSFIHHNSKYEFGIGHILFTWALLAGTFEWYLPVRSSIYTSDPMDLVAYFVGALIFYIFINKHSYRSLKSIV